MKTYNPNTEENTKWISGPIARTISALDAGDADKSVLLLNALMSCIDPKPAQPACRLEKVFVEAHCGNLEEALALLERIDRREKRRTNKRWQ